MHIEPDELQHPRADDRPIPRDPPRLTLASTGPRSQATASARTAPESFRIDIHPEREVGTALTGVNVAG